MRSWWAMSVRNAWIASTTTARSPLPPLTTLTALLSPTPARPRRRKHRRGRAGCASVIGRQLHLTIVQLFDFIGNGLGNCVCVALRADGFRHLATVLRLLAAENHAELQAGPQTCEDEAATRRDDGHDVSGDPSGVAENICRTMARLQARTAGAAQDQPRLQ